MNLQELSELRRKTEAISHSMSERLEHYLETLKPLFTPERLFGRAAGTKTDLRGADQMLTLLREKYREVSGLPFGLPEQFDPQWLSLVGSQVQLQPWEYRHEAKSDKETKTIIITSPVCWVLGFGSDGGLAQFRQVIAEKDQRRYDWARQFVVNALVMQFLFAKTPGLVRLLGDLRYDVKTQPMPELPKVPLTTVTACLPSFRPPDDLILAATAFSGVPAFIELVDLNRLTELQDPLRARIEEVAK